MNPSTHLKSQPWERQGAHARLTPPTSAKFPRGCPWHEIGCTQTCIRSPVAGATHLLGERTRPRWRTPQTLNTILVGIALWPLHDREVTPPNVAGISRLQTGCDLEAKHANGPKHNLEAKRMEDENGRPRRWKSRLGNSRPRRQPWMIKRYVRERCMDGDEKLWPAPPANSQLPTAQIHFNRGCAQPCPSHTFHSCPNQSPPSMWNNLPVAHAPSLPGAGRF